MEAPRRSARPAADVLMSPPPHLLDAILLRLRLRDAVRTSALSRAWRRRWEALPELPHLSFPVRTPPEVVDGILARYTGRVPRFSLCVDRRSAGRVGDWIVALSRRGVRSISIRGNFTWVLQLHPRVFSCTHLVSLDLRNILLPLLPAGFAGFPALTMLKFAYVHFATDWNQLAGIIAGSPLLQDLTLYEVEFDHALRDWTILSESEEDWQIGELLHLQRACIRLPLDRDLVKLLGSFAHVRKLNLYAMHEHDPEVGGENSLEKLPCIFHNVKTLTYGTSLSRMHGISSTYSLLRNAPNLEELQIVMEPEEETEGNTEFQNAQWTNGLCAKLQVVRMKRVSCSPNEMSFIELVLSRATALRTMSISLGPLPDRRKSNEDALCELMTYRRASPHAQVFFDGKV